MADSQGNMVSIVAIVAILILVGLVAYFIMQDQDDDIEIDLGGVPPAVMLI